jgi:hypothetical protein
MVAKPQGEAQRATKEVAYNMKQRVQQELAYPAVIHFYTWLLHGAGPAGGVSLHSSTNSTFTPGCCMVRDPQVASVQEHTTPCNAAVMAGSLSVASLTSPMCSWRNSSIKCFNRHCLRPLSHAFICVNAGYQGNGRAVNHILVSFLQRIAHPVHGLNLEPMLYQVPTLQRRSVLSVNCHRGRSNACV